MMKSSRNGRRTDLPLPAFSPPSDGTGVKDKREEERRERGEGKEEEKVNEVRGVDWHSTQADRQRRGGVGDLYCNRDARCEIEAWHFWGCLWWHTCCNQRHLSHPCDWQQGLKSRLNYHHRNSHGQDRTGMDLTLHQRGKVSENKIINYYIQNYSLTPADAN